MISLCHGPAGLLAAGIGERKEDFLYRGYEMCVFPDSLDTGANIDIGYIPGPMPWLVGERLRERGVKIVNADITGKVHKDRRLLTGDSPLASTTSASWRRRRCWPTSPRDERRDRAARFPDGAGDGPRANPVRHSGAGSRLCRAVRLRSLCAVFRFRHGGGGDQHIYWVEGDWFGDGEAVDALTYVRHCPVTRHMLRVSEPFFWTKTRVQQGERYRIVRTPRGAACTACRSRCSAWPVWRAPSAWGRAYRRFTAGAAGAVAGGLGGLSGGAAAVRTGGRRGEGRLSAREREVLSWTAIGRRQADIAAMLGLSERTVENHLRRIRQRLGAATTAQAIGVAIRLGRSPRAPLARRHLPQQPLAQRDDIGALRGFFGGHQVIVGAG